MNDVLTMVTLLAVLVIVIGSFIRICVGIRRGGGSLTTILWCFDESSLPDKTLDYVREVLSRRENFCSSDEQVSYATHGMREDALG